MSWAPTPSGRVLAAIGRGVVALEDAGTSSRLRGEPGAGAQGTSAVSRAGLSTRHLPPTSSSRSSLSLAPYARLSGGPWSEMLVQPGRSGAHAQRREPGVDQEVYESFDRWLVLSHKLVPIRSHRTAVGASDAGTSRGSFGITWCSAN